MTIEWISVEDRLPETTGHSEQYLVYDCDEDFHVISWMNIGGWCWDAIYSDNITHWAVIPKPIENKEVQ